MSTNYAMPQWVFILLCLLPSLFSMTWALTDRPNIVFIVADDMGFNDVGFHGSDVRTPNLDALAGHGIILNRHYTLPTCSPSRTALLTSRYPIRTGMQGMPIRAGSGKGVPLEETFFPQYFKKLGYKTHLVGKWHLGFKSWAYTPMHRGFDTFYGFLNGAVGYYDCVFTDLGATGRDFWRNKTPIWEEVYGTYLTHLLTNEATSVIKNYNGYEGLLLFLTHAAPHKGNLDFIREAAPGEVDANPERKILAGMVRELDNSVGEVISSLNDKGILNNTIIVFISDNGAPTVDTVFGYYNRGSNWPLRGLKVSTHDGGVRTPAVIWSPSFREPRVSSELFHITDWLPTLYAAAGGKPKMLKNIDGINHWPSLMNNFPGPRDEALINMDEIWNNEGLISGKWKIVKNFAPSSMSYIDTYFGESGRGVPYDPADVENSVAGSILGRPPAPYDVVRQRAMVNATCLDIASAESSDCHTKYCLYEILVDVVECRDRSADFPEVVSALESKLAIYRKMMVPTQNNTIDWRGRPRSWDDYWKPWLPSGSDRLAASAILVPIFLLIRFLHFVF